MADIGLWHNQLSFPRSKFEYSSSNLLYQGTHINPAASDDDLEWIITKYEWTTGNVTQTQTIIGSWTGRAGLAWAF